MLCNFAICKQNSTKFAYYFVVMCNVWPIFKTSEHLRICSGTLSGQFWTVISGSVLAVSNMVCMQSASYTEAWNTVQCMYLCVTVHTLLVLYMPFKCLLQDWPYRGRSVEKGFLYEVCRCGMCLYMYVYVVLVLMHVCVYVHNMCPYVYILYLLV